MVFGPRPPGRHRPGPTPRRTPATSSTVRLILAAGLLVSAALALVPTALGGSEASHADAVGSPVPATTTLDLAGVKWSSTTGVLGVAKGDGKAVELQVGRAGDLAAVGRWTCTDDVTLGVYRPETGEWFVFTDWRDHTVSLPPITLTPGATELRVSADPSGTCDRPHPAP